MWWWWWWCMCACVQVIIGLHACVSSVQVFRALLAWFVQYIMTGNNNITTKRRAESRVVFVYILRNILNYRHRRWRGVYGHSNRCTKQNMTQSSSRLSLYTNSAHYTCIVCHEKVEIQCRTKSTTSHCTYFVKFLCSPAYNVRAQCHLHTW